LKFRDIQKVHETHKGRIKHAVDDPFKVYVCNLSPVRFLIYISSISSVEVSQFRKTGSRKIVYYKVFIFAWSLTKRSGKTAFSQPIFTRHKRENS